MKICIDMRSALSRPTGVGIYLQNLVQALSEIDQQNEYHLFSSSWKERYHPVDYGPNFKIQDRRWPVRLLNYGWNHLSFPSIEFLLGTPVQVAHSPTPMLIPSLRARRVTTVHDLYFYIHPEQVVREMKTDFPRMLKKHCMRSDAIIAVSEYTKKQLIEILRIPSSRIYTIKHGIDPFYFTRATQIETTEVLRKFNIPGAYFLFVGTQEPRKNLSVLFDAFRNLDQGVSLVLAGPEGWGSGETDVPNGVIRTGYVSQKDLRSLYQQSIAVIFPSLEEGFGLPLLEGMASEVPVIASRIPVFQEVCEDSCLYFDPSSAEDLTLQMRAVLQNESMRQTMISKGKERVKKFSWKETAQKTLELYQSL